ncbi:MAG: UDP-glucose--hexose-1-phosphate uridylyltransferase, partial [Lachnospiraceae bacterium]|nr:UDP-glucose--hexose-1-phosphate uridylyltransferase [Lachnospiraceae bacterium]
MRRIVMGDINKLIRQLVNYGMDKGLVAKEDEVYTINRILEVLKVNEYTEPEETPENAELETILSGLLDFAYENGVMEENSIAYRDLMDTKIMGCLVPPPSVVVGKFNELYKKSPQEATDFYYNFSCDTDYIRRYRIVKDMKWTADTEYGRLDVTINLSKPEKDPKAIAAARNAKQSAYPKCQLCVENEGYAGRLDHPARETHRIIPITIDGGKWGFQYSPYVYYNEHCIVLNSEHTPMKIDESAFRKLFDFIKLFPHYFIGSNADLPIVGGSILTHEHFQGGHYEFAMERAGIRQEITIKGYEDVHAGIVNWPMSVIRISHNDSDRLVKLASHILDTWRAYTDEDAFIFATTDGEPHNTITPIARMRDGKFELDLVLRNNITTEEHPLGVYHPHQELHHIKKENIGLIEVMGLAVLPARLKNEMKKLGEFIVSGKDIRSDEELAKHADWVEEFKPAYGQIDENNVDGIIQKEIGIVFKKVLEHAGVFKNDEKG